MEGADCETYLELLKELDYRVVVCRDILGRTDEEQNGGIYRLCCGERLACTPCHDIANSLEGLEHVLQGTKDGISLAAEGGEVAVVVVELAIEVVD